MTSEIGAAGETVEGEARVWIARLKSAAVPAADLEAFKRWADGSDARKLAVAQAHLEWKTMAAAAQRLHIRTDERRKLSRRAIGSGAAIAASAAIAAAARPPFALWPSMAEFLADYRTATGQQKEIKFAETVSVALNTRTSIIRNTARELEVITGEVAVTASSPVVVKADAGLVRATSGAFNLYRRVEAVDVTCLKGDVEVECAFGTAQLTSGQQVRYTSGELGNVSAADPETATAWRRGLLVFESKPVSDVVAELNRYWRGKIFVVNPALARMSLDATFRLDRIEEAVRKIAAVFEATVLELPGGIVVLR